MARSLDYLGAVGIGVSDMDRSVDFYTRVLGMQKAQTFKLDYMDEVVVSHEGRNAVVLMHYTDGSARNYKDNPVKLVFYVTDPKAMTDKIRADGLEITREATPIDTLGGAIVGLAKDPDGYVLEFLHGAAAQAMKLAKPHLDIGMYVRETEPALAFWRDEVGAVFDHVLALGPGQRQHRHDLYGSVLKINNSRDPRAHAPPTGYRELIVARGDVSEPKALADPEGNRVTLVAPGTWGVEKVGVRLAVRDVEAHRRFYVGALGLAEEPVDGAAAAFRAGDSLILIDRSDDAPSDAQIGGYGWRYITFQIHKVDEEHAHALAHGAREGRAPVTLGETARISMIRDPDGNWIELSQRASITGSLEP